MNKNFINKLYDKISLNPPMVLSLGFAILITVGGLLLSLPFFTKSGQATPLVDSLFVAASASCVTGLTPVNTLEHWNTYGHIIIIILIQIGGLGVMSLASIIPLILGKKIGMKSRQILKEQLNVESLEGMIVLFKYVLAFTFATEILGAILLSIKFVPLYGAGKGVWYAVFHSISAFCNAGFDILGDSIYPFREDLLINLTLCALVIVGGLGFVVTSELFRRRSFKKLSTYSKLVLMVTAILLIFGTLMFLFLENEDGVLQYESLKGSILESFFQSVVARTAGFYSVDLSKIKDSTALMLMGLMFVGGSPGSTAGGIKTTTLGVLFLSTHAVVRGESEPVVFGRHISTETVRKALAIFLVSIVIVISVSFMLTITESAPLVDILYETVSALATVGASKGITPQLTDAGKNLITLCMYLGRIGPMTMAFAFGMKAKKSLIRYPESFISIG
ncbi:TrkH family potassium uptake protein [Anaerococcus degeneri]|uniref:TrkH family potassium uptake protein n=1 Tax=Anaerococcus degeneri TaxID=361500 RepID=A0ABS7YWS3_9FIRM|nr:TrkH family potassium uptake protein [Anaerococcus degeneri]MBP2015291.1 trk system potassium uptake protein TrkH [Anaerococcus degeneri]MCA2096187.1 TrkH family potassium uptake protein [Anaerococcus degeneri]